jgi:hypothetical protein
LSAGSARAQSIAGVNRWKSERRLFRRERRNDLGCVLNRQMRKRKS